MAELRVLLLVLPREKATSPRSRGGAPTASAPALARERMLAWVRAQAEPEGEGAG
jgi:hypothetical protein